MWTSRTIRTIPERCWYGPGKGSTNEGFSHPFRVALAICGPEIMGRLWGDYGEKVLTRAYGGKIFTFPRGMGLKFWLAWLLQ